MGMERSEQWRLEHRPLASSREARSRSCCPGAHDGLSARLIEQAGFAGLFVGGFASIGARHAMPDVGLMGLADISAVARDVRAATTLPMMVDADDGYGDAKNVGPHRAHLRAPRRTGHLHGRSGLAQALRPPRREDDRVRAAHGNEDSCCGR